MSEIQSEWKYEKRRYFILVLLGLFTATNFYQHYEFSAITNVVSKFYNISATNVNWTSLLYNIGSVIMFYPIMKCIESFGFRTTTILVTFANAIGPAIKCMSLQSNAYGILLLGQTFPAFVTIVMPSLAALFAAVWFKSEHVAFVISSNIVFLNFGSAAAFLSPSILFSGDKNNLKILRGLSLISVVLVLITSAIFVLSVVVVREKPQSPPSVAQWVREKQKSNKSWSELFANKNFILLTIIFSMILALSQTLSVILNQSILAQFPNGNRIVTIAGILSLIPAMFSSPLMGFICKKCKKYKMMLIVSSFLVTISMSFYTLFVYLKSELMIYTFIFLTGFFYSGVYVLAMDFIVEVTYPYSEGITINTATLIACLPAILLLPLTSSLITKYGSTAGNFALLASSALNFLISFFVDEDLRRMKANLECIPLL
ncbi:feline leukemia virus subgroup C receptor-related protein 2-like protein [Dinothrombium tinctorium]|uniref:Feline leukemia virus subgroup C receptor-related protein 2-like protein n=1 Tax=Dinothrombium tinctorium TaxID=1965070 RepID=A0A3S3NRE0_9ACAR|nr:feline leukemia virus subgroup C receptor-related protein 2-like protein [Dinothrombium tinctorium]